MQLSYSSYKNDITSFSSEEYIKNLENSISHDIFFKFIENYKEIENEDFKKPIFSQTSKFKKIPNNFKNYKYMKINRDNNNDEETKNKWVFESPKEESDKIAILIKTYLNKISQDTYKKISIEFINELVQVENEKLFEILSGEILNKCLFDNKYRNLYINLCYKIWSNKQIHNNLIILTDKNNDNSYFWSSKYDNILIGPFNTENNAKNDAFNTLNFKKYFLNYIQNLYFKKDLSFTNLNEEEVFIKKKKILLLVELIGIIFLERYINFDIINIIIIDLLHLNDNFKNIEDIEYEALYNLIKLIKDNKTLFNDLSENKIIFDEYTIIINQIINNTNNVISKRSLFFLNDILDMINTFINDKTTKKINTNIEKEQPKIRDNFKNIFMENLKNKNFGDLLNIYIKINNDEKDEVVYKTIDTFISLKTNNDNIIKFLNNINNIDLFSNNLEKIVNNINDILLDIPNANEKLLYLLENIKDNFEKKEIFISILKNIDSDKEED
jgi:hypothetical protein